MRNLKKILALVLALVMSLSLMATASAADFKDASDISENYQTAVNVLEGLKVFKGYAEDNTFRPKGEITRAEVATIIYRIATGDAEDAQASIYTNMTTSFTDLDKAEWARGYINYCHNAQIIKGESASKFNPNGKISGYATLAMILRAMGYGRNGEFEGPQWEINTAAKAKEIGIIDNVMEAQLGSNAPRELVAEILFRALLTEMVDYTILNGYQPNGKTLGKEQFGLEEITGVIMANQWAALDDDVVMAVDTTRMLVTDVQKVGATAEVGKTVTLDSATELEAVGMSYVAYVAGKSTNKQTLTLAEGANTVGFNEGKAINTNNSDQGYKALKDLGVALNDKTEYYVDYEENWENDATSDFLIRYVVTVKSITDSYDNKWISLDTKDAWLKFLKDNAVVTKGTAADPIEYTRTIRPDARITETDQAIMKEIFYSADRDLDNTLHPLIYIKGEVFVGTASTKDVSDTMSWKQFVAEYFNDTKTYQKFVSAENGESVRTIDNNGDGVAEYALKVTYTMDKVVGTYKDALLLNTKAFANYSAEKNTLIAPELEQNDVVVYSLIDKQLHVRKAEVDTDTIKTHSFKDITITTEGGETYGQSGIFNETGMDELIRNMNDKTEYIMYKDLFNFVRAYELAQGTKYALITEMYTNGTWNENYVVNNRLTAEVKVADEAIKEYVVANAAATPLRSRCAWSSAYSGYSVANLNYLQPAIAHLGYLNNIANSINPDYPTYYAGATTPTSLANVTVSNPVANSDTAYALGNWYRTVWEMAASGGAYGVFDYGPEGGVAAALTSAGGPAEHTSSFTNVAAYTSAGDNAVTLNTASELLVDAKGEQVYYMGKTNIGKNTEKTTCTEWMAKTGLSRYDFADRLRGTNTYGNNGSYERFYRVYKTDYVQLALNALGSTDVAVKANTVHYPVDVNYRNLYNSFDGVNNYVNATVDTEFYIVMPGYGVDNVQYYKGVANLPTILKGEIRAAYAVAHNTAKTSADNDYWVADVIVIETNKLDHNWESVSLMYYSPYETSAAVFSVSSLNSQWRTYQPDSTNRAMIDITPIGVTNASGGAWVDWSNSAWLDKAYGFYSLYQTEAVSDGNVTAKDARRITKDFNSYGIYAGFVTATEGLQTTGYIDVDVIKTGTNNTEAIWVGYTTNDVPVYRITTGYDNRVNTAGEIALNVVDRYSDVKPGDPIIWVYEKNTGKLAFVVDLATRYTNGNPDFIVPSWLYNAAEIVSTAVSPDKVVANPSSEFAKIYKEENKTVTEQAGYTITFVPGNLPSSITNGMMPAGINGSTVYKVIAGNTSTNIPLSAFNATTAMMNAGFTGIAAAGSAGTPAANTAFVAPAGVSVKDDGTNLEISGVTSNVTIKVNYTLAANDIKLSASLVAPVNSVTAAYKDASLTAQSETLNTTGTTNDAAVGQTVTLTIALSTALGTNQTLNVTAVGDPSGKEYAISAPEINAARTSATCTFTMPNEDVEVTAEVKNAQYTIIFSGNVTNGVDKVNVGAAYGGTTLTMKPGYALKSWTATNAAGAVVASGDTVTVGSFTPTSNVTISVDSELAEYDLLIATPTGGSAASIVGIGVKYSNDGGNTWTTVANVVPGTTAIKVTVNTVVNVSFQSIADSVQVTTDGTAALVPPVNPSVVGQANNTYSEWTMTGIAQNAQVNITKA